MAAPSFLALLASLLLVPALPAPLERGWEVAESPAGDAEAIPAAAWRACDVTAPSDGAPRRLWLRLGLELPPALAERSLAIEFTGFNAGDDPFLDGVRLRRASAARSLAFSSRRGEEIFEVPGRAASAAGPHRLTVRLTPRPAGEPIWLEPPVLDSLQATLERSLLRQLPRLVTAVATASFGLLALLFFLRDRTRRGLGLYALFAFGISLYISLSLSLWPRLGVPLEALRRTVEALTFLLPAMGYLFLLHFLDLPVSWWRRALLLPPAAGLLLVLFRAASSMQGALVGAALFLLGGELLLALFRQARRRRSDAVLLFIGTAVLLLSALTDAASERGILLSGRLRVGLLGPAFLVFTSLLLVAVADEGRRLLVRATIDPLTGVCNRQEFLRRAEAEIARAERTGGTLALAMLDIDHFKSFNDRFGHQAGDRVLASVARAIAETVRGLDVAGRYGGEEFILLLVNPAEQMAVPAVERVRAAIAALAPPQVPERITMSAGVAVHNGLFEQATVTELIRRADAALYDSKRAGRDRATLEGTRTEPPTSAADVRYR